MASMSVGTVRVSMRPKIRTRGIRRFFLLLLLPPAHLVRDMSTSGKKLTFSFSFLFTGIDLLIS